VVAKSNFLASIKEKTKAKYWASVNKRLEVEKETDTSVGRLLVKHTVGLLREHLDPWLDHAVKSPGRRHSAVDVFSLIDDPDLLAVLIIRAILDGVSQPRPMTNLALRVGTAIEQEARMREVKTTHPEMYKTLRKMMYSNRCEDRQAKWVLSGLKELRGITIPRLPSDTRLRAGLVALDLFVQSTGLVEVTKEKRGKKLVRLVSGSDALVTWLSKAHEAHELLRPLLPPMTSPPVDWTALDAGGYKSLPLTLIKKARQKIYDDMKAPAVYSATNILQATPFTINEKVLEVMTECWERSLELGGLPTAELMPFPNKPLDIDTNPEARKEYGRQASWVRSYNNGQKSRRLHIAQLLSLANEYSGYDIWMPVTLDFRGRMYSTPGVLNPMSSSFAKSLLQFSKGMPMQTDAEDGEEAFRLHGANAWGLSRWDIESRIQWTHANQEEIVACAKDPFSFQFWMRGEKPWEFLAWAFEFADFLKVGRGFLNHLPISVDCSNNGCQIWSLLLRDEKTAEATNVLAGDSPQDLYQLVADAVISALDGDHSEFGLIWRNSGLVDRSLVKTATMIIPYSATLQGMGEAVHTSMLSKAGDSPLPPWSNRRAAYYMAGLIREAAYDIIPAVLKGMTWMRDVTGICADNSIPLEWTLPTGFRVVNDYRKPRYKSVQTWMGEAYTTSTIASPSRQLAKGRCRQTVTANFTHSCDAAVLHNTIVKAHDCGVSSFAVVHDSFGTHALKVDTLQRSLRSSVAQLFSHDLLNDIREQAMSLLPDKVEVPSPPLVGDLDVSCVTNSTYFAS